MSETTQEQAAAEQTQAAASSTQAQTASELDALEDELHEARIDAHGRARRIRTLDFSQPTKFTAEFRRRIGRVLGPFCEAVSNRLSAELRAPVELRLSDSSQLTWSAAKAALPASSISVALDVRPIDRQMLLDIELPIVLQALECLLGGTAEQAPAERRLSEIDWALARGVLDAIVAQLALAWRELGGLELVPGDIDVEGDAGVFVPIGEPTFALTLECRIDGQRSNIALLIPWSAIEPIAAELLTEERLAGPADPREARAVQSSLAAAEVVLRAEIGAATMSMKELLELTPGTVLALPNRAEDGVQLFAEDVALGHGRPGLRGARRAVKLTSTTSDAQARASSARREGDCVVADTSVARMLGVQVRVWAELGRARIGVGRALELPPGAVVELEQSTDDPIDLFVNGKRFATGSLQVSGDGEWVVHVERLA